MNAHDNMTLRDWFAGLALQGYLTAPNTDYCVSYEAFASDAYKQADAMLEERAKTAFRVEGDML